jgi:membrane associated rhomboid family serine protease
VSAGVDLTARRSRYNGWMQVARDSSFSDSTFRRVPPAVLWLILVTLAASLAGHWLAPYGILIPRLFWSGQVWRLVTWVFFEGAPLKLVFQCLMLYWFGRDLETRWGTRGLIAVYLGFAAATGAATCLVALASPTVMSIGYSGGWALGEALTIAWALFFPDRDVFLLLILRMRGRVLIIATIVLTFLFVIYYGIAFFLPDLFAEGMMLLFMSDVGPSMRRRWERWRLRRRGPQLRIVEDDEEPPPAPPPSRPHRWVN